MNYDTNLMILSHKLFLSLLRNCKTDIYFATRDKLSRSQETLQSSGPTYMGMAVDYLA
jgi:hypothetical protein